MQCVLEAKTVVKSWKCGELAKRDLGAMWEKNEE